MAPTIPSPVSTGQSIGGATTPINNLPSIGIATLTPPSGTLPSRALDGPNPIDMNKIFRFPSDTPPYYLSLAINNYSRESWNTVGKLTETNRIILPLPPMIDNHNVRYAVEDIGLAGGAGFNAILGNLKLAAEQAAIDTALNVAKFAAGKLGQAGALASKAGSGALAAAGVAVNGFLTVMLKGPEYKKRDFIWRFAPRTPQETESLRQIIQLINNSMAPKLIGATSAFFTWPKIFKPQFVWGGVDDYLAKQTFRMKPSVVTDFSINYTPNGMFSPFAQTKAPASIEMRMSLLEIELWLGDQFNDIPGTGFDGVTGNQTINDILNSATLNGGNGQTTPSGDAGAAPATTPFNNAGNPLP